MEELDLSNSKWVLSQDLSLEIIDNEPLFTNEDPDIIINESFNDNNDFSFDSIKNFDNSSKELLKLKLEASEISKDTEIRELIAYPKIKKHHHSDGGKLADAKCTGKNTNLADKETKSVGLTRQA